MSSHWLGQDFVVTVRHTDKPDLAAVRKRLENDAPLLAHGPAVLHAMMDEIVDDHAPVLDGLLDGIDAPGYDEHPARPPFQTHDLTQI